MRLATGADLDAIMRLLEAFVADRTPRRGRARYLQAIRAEQARLLEDRDTSWFVAERNEVVVGCARAKLEQDHALLAYLDRKTYGYVFGLYVVPDARSAGIGRQLVSRCETWLRARGAKYCFLHSIPDAVAFYEEQGYEPTFELGKKL